jgi:hypothetical protein
MENNFSDHHRVKNLNTGNSQMLPLIIVFLIDSSPALSLMNPGSSSEYCVGDPANYGLPALQGPTGSFTSTVHSLGRGV